MNAEQIEELFKTSDRLVGAVSSDFHRYLEVDWRDRLICIAGARGTGKTTMLRQRMKETFGVTFGNRIRRQIGEYVSVYIGCGGTELEALDDIIAKKVLRKLEAQNPVYVKSKAEELSSKLNEVFGQGMCPVSDEYVRKLVNNA